MSSPDEAQAPVVEGLERKRAALEAVLNSDTFARTDQLKRFLRYVCEMELSGRGHQITEYSIAVEALGRRPTYSPEADSAVRTSARALREKLKRFYEQESPAAELQIEIPKGIYTPRFVERQAPEAPQPSVNGKAVIQEDRTARAAAWIPLSVGALILGVALGLGIARWVWPARTAPVDPVLKAAWAPWSGPGPSVLVCFSTPLQFMIRSLPDPVAPTGSLPLPDSLSSFRRTFDEVQGRPDAPQLFLELSTVSTTLGETAAALRAAQVLQALGTEFKAVPTRSVKMPIITSHRSIVLGNPEYSETTRRLLERGVYTIRYDAELKEPVLTRRRSGADRDWQRTVERRDGLVNASFGLITVLPVERGRPVLSFAGLSSAGIQAAAEFFATPSSLAELRQRFRERGYPQFPPAYQVVVRCAAYQDQMLSYQYEALEILDAPRGNRP